MGWIQKKQTVIGGVRMAWAEMGEGRPVVFLHGNPTSSYLWRNIMPHVRHLGRCIAPDLIGMGDSGKLEESGPDQYGFFAHRDYLDRLLEEIGVTGEVTLVVHDWGSALGFDWANRHRRSVRGIAYMEAIVRPLSWAEWPASSRPVFSALRSEAGEDLVLRRNIFVERILPGSIMRELGDDEMAEYRRPFAAEGEDRRPTLTWPRQIPIDGEPAEVVSVVQDYADWLRTASVPKLFVNADPGAILVGPVREFCRGWPNQTEVTVPGIHFIQEDSPDQIGQAIAAWMATI